MSARFVENRFKTVKLWLKQDYKGLFVKILNKQKQKEKDYFVNLLKLDWTAG